MGHHISGVVARSGLFRSLGKEFDGQQPIELVDGFSFLPLDHENLDGIVGLNAGEAVEHFEYLTQALLTLLSRSSSVGDLAYIETGYFGGNGGQRAVAFRGGGLSFGPAYREIGPINEALSILGVRAGANARDEFDAVGLGKHRSNEDFRSITSAT